MSSSHSFSKCEILLRLESSLQSQRNRHSIVKQHEKQIYRSPSALLPFLGGFPTKIDDRKKSGTLILEDLETQDKPRGRIHPLRLERRPEPMRLRTVPRYFTDRFNESNRASGVVSH